MLGVDSLDDPTGKEGLSELMTSTMADATDKVPEQELSDSEAMLGTHISPTRFTTTTNNFRAAILLLGQIIERPSFPEDGVARAKSAIAQRVQSQYAATAPVRVFFSILLAPGNPARRTATPASVDALTRADVVSFYKTAIRPSRTTVIIVGDVMPTQAFAFAKSAFGKWIVTSAMETRPSEFPVNAATPTTIYLVDVPGRLRTSILVGQLGPQRDTAVMPAVDVLADILGQVGGSRLQVELRDRRGFMYAGIPYGVDWRPTPQRSIQAGSASVDAVKVDSALIAWLGALRDVRGPSPVTAKELDFAEGVAVASLPTRFETTDSVASQVAEAVRYGGELRDLEQYVRAVRGLSPEKVTRAAERYIDPGHLTIVVAGDRKTLEPLLRRADIAPIVIVDENGNPKP
ncbi:MAG TPA: pitrilysin family protein [Gemmatimonadaceae bacterium]|nr:pitrilysin family protein [Gemmatimonadaceae bacterium]